MTIAIGDFLPDVYLLTDRPNLVNESVAALNRALKKCHFASRFKFDRQVVQIPSTESPFAYPTPDRFRDVETIDGPDFNVKEISPSSLFAKDVMVDKRNVYYIAGSDIQFTITDSYTFLNFIYLRNPDWVDSYIAANFREMIIDFAVASVKAYIGADPTDIKYYEVKGNEMLQQIIQSHFAV